MKYEKMNVVKKKKMPFKYVLCVLLGALLLYVCGYFIFIGVNFQK